MVSCQDGVASDTGTELSKMEIFFPNDTETHGTPCETETHDIPSETEAVEVDGALSKTGTDDGTLAGSGMGRVIPTPVRPPLLRATPKSKGTPSAKTKLKVKTAAKTKAKKAEKSPKSTRKAKSKEVAKKPKTSPQQKATNRKSKDEIEKKLHSVSKLKHYTHTTGYSCANISNQ
jgi:hypothetical protein